MRRLGDADRSYCDDDRGSPWVFTTEEEHALVGFLAGYSGLTA
jgi:hypothetical protein